MKQNKMEQKGFTIIEVVIAIFILTVAVIGIYSAFSVMMVATSQMSDRFVASYLAQEGIEVIRNMRDNNWINSQEDWTAGISCGNSFCDWNADYETGTTDEAVLNAWIGGDEDRRNNLNIDTSNFYSNSPNGNITRFRRKITVEPVDNDEGTYALKVAVTVFWDEKASVFNFAKPYGSVTAEEYLYNWY